WLPRWPTVRVLRMGSVPVASLDGIVARERRSHTASGSIADERERLGDEREGTTAGQTVVTEGVAQKLGDGAPIEPVGGQDASRCREARPALPLDTTRGTARSVVRPYGRRTARGELPARGMRSSGCAPSIV